MQVLAAEVQQVPVARSVRSTRIDALDWTKGALVVCMVVYHAINYSAFRPMAFRYLAFLPSSFIMIAGFLVGQVYATKYDLGSWRPYARLAVRGTKVLLLFTALNVGLWVVRERNVFDGLLEFAERSPAIFISGNGRGGIFEVLLPIAYFLLLAPVLLWLRARTSAAIAIFAVAIFALCLFLETNGKASKNLDLLSAGFIGMALGRIPVKSVNRFAMQWVAVVVLYALYRLCSYTLGETYPVQTFGAAVTILLLYCWALRLDTATWLGRQMVTFGKYSLFSYLAQIAAIQAVVKLLGGRPSHWAGVFFVAAVTTTLLFLAVQAIHTLRQQSRFVDATYRAIFA